MKKLVVIVMMLVAGTAGAADKPGAEILGRWVGGTWPLEGKMVDSDFSKAATLKGLSTCNWSPEHVFVVCDEIVYVNGEPERNLGIYSYDKKSDTYHYVEITPEGRRPALNELVISADGNRWEYRGSSEVKGEKVQFRTINEYRSSDSIEWWSEYSKDQGQHWTKMGGGSEKRER